MSNDDKYDIDRVLRRRKIKKIIALLATGALITKGIIHFNPNIKLPNIQFSKNDDKEENTITNDQPVNNNTTDYEYTDNEVEYTDNEVEYTDNEYEDKIIEDNQIKEETSAAEVSHDVYSRAAELIDDYIYYDPNLASTLPSIEEIANIIDFMNGDYEVSTRAEAQAMYDKLFEYYIIILNSPNFIKRVNEHAETLIDFQDDYPAQVYTYIKPTTSTYSGEPYEADLTDLIITNKNIDVLPILKRLDELHRLILSSNDVEERDELLMEVDRILTNMYYGGEEVDGIYYSTFQLLQKENVAAASLLEQYVFEFLPFLSNISGTNSAFYNEIYNGDGEFINEWKNNLFEANMDGKYSYTLK